MIDADKENRLPAGMATGKNATPGRRRKTEYQYFDVGKVGRKTGITLPDKGIRDEHGFEPMEGIFSSPTSPQRHADRTLTSSDMDMQKSSAPEVEQTLHLRKTPKLPPPRAATPKHTNIGSPKRGSTGRPATTGRTLISLDENSTSPVQVAPKTQPPPNRKLDFASNGVRRSIEGLSPFKPKKSLRRSTGPERQNPFASPERTRTVHASEEASVHEEDPVPQTSETLRMDDAPMTIDDDDDYALPVAPLQISEDLEEASVQELEPSISARRKSVRSRKSIPGDTSEPQQTPPFGLAKSGTKRSRASVESEVEDFPVNLSSEPIEPVVVSPPQKKQRGNVAKGKARVQEETVVDASIDPSLLAQGDSYVEEVEQVEEVEEVAEPVSVEPQPQESNRGRQKKKKTAPHKERDPNRAVRATTSPVKQHDGPSQASRTPGKRSASRGGSMGPSNNFTLRATTPFEDATCTSRSGRPIMKPLQYWANEGRIWKRGETAGIIRAEEVVKPTSSKGRKKKPRKTITKLADIDEESEAESTCADEWEESMGVIAGNVTQWDPETQTGNPDSLIVEDLAFAASAIITSDVAGSTFKYAKIMTLPFFGAGLVELPPSGQKRSKNSRKMQMCFFVHEGKVMVEVGIGVGGTGNVNRFAVSKGGVCVVPRGNNYALTNESTTKTAKVFFAQGCEVAA